MLGSMFWLADTSLEREKRIHWDEPDKVKRCLQSRETQESSHCASVFQHRLSGYRSYEALTRRYWSCQGLYGWGGIESCGRQEPVQGVSCTFFPSCKLIFAHCCQMMACTRCFVQAILRSVATVGRAVLQARRRRSGLLSVIKATRRFWP